MMHWAVGFSIVALAAMSVADGQEQHDRLDLTLPTDNDALLRGDGAAFYQVIARDFQGVESTPWEGGQYGFVRDPIETHAGIIYKRFHEGIDIRPLRRDARGEPLDEVRTIAAGRVVHVNVVPGFSNYGNYVVVEHRWDGASYYSLYAHLHSVSVHVEQHVQRGETLGIMGHTGAGIDKERAHVHLELNLMLSREFESWYNVYFKSDPNRNGLYNGMNLAGVDIARLYQELQKQPALTMGEFLSQEATFYKVTFPDSKHVDLAKRYPWLLQRSSTRETKSWEVSFAQSGVPLKIEASHRAVTQPELTYFKKSDVGYFYLTRGTLSGRDERAALSESGKCFMRLLIYPD